jgi:hypothetical protein
MGERTVSAETATESDTRRQYRVTPASAGDLSVGILVEDGEPRVPGQVVDISAGGIAVLFGVQSPPVYEIGQTLLLEMTSPHLGDRMVTPALVDHREECSEGRLYGFEFLDRLGLLARLPAELAGLFNQRRICRVEPDPENPVLVTVEGIGVAFELQVFLRDLSTEGLSFRAPPLVEVALSKTRMVKVSFSLPDSPVPLRFQATIVHRDLIAGSICYGVCFYQERTPNFEEKQAKLEEYAHTCRERALAALAKQRDAAVAKQRDAALEDCP